MGIPFLFGHKKTRRSGLFAYQLVGRAGFEPAKSKDNRFTVCPIWPLWNLPDCCNAERTIGGHTRVGKIFLSTVGKESVDLRG